MDKIVSLPNGAVCVCRFEIYGGIAGMYDYGPLGVLLKNNLKDLWWRMFVMIADMPLDSAIIMNSKVWEASGHLAGFSDPLVDGKQFNICFKLRLSGRRSVFPICDRKRRRFYQF